MQDRERTVLGENTHQTVCHLSCCLGLEWSQDDELAEVSPSSLRVADVRYDQQIHQVCLSPMPNGVWDNRLVYNLMCGLPTSNSPTSLTEIHSERVVSLVEVYDYHTLPSISLFWSVPITGGVHPLMSPTGP